ncbi:hypothetical protein RF11_03435 [Thelohanellus kitauei]|uniref:GATA-type domain-containing protein n=1 Tax=Thelohanellus kitauei TaxID=669202 RepID=A0A0C2JBN1_THEKT|nr:hypothetical protein RF11_03435 [Thelohanellus kitauei]
MSIPDSSSNEQMNCQTDDQAYQAEYSFNSSQVQLYTLQTRQAQDNSGQTCSLYCPVTIMMPVPLVSIRPVNTVPNPTSSNYGTIGSANTCSDRSVIMPHCGNMSKYLQSPANTNSHSGDTEQDLSGSLNHSQQINVTSTAENNDVALCSGNYWTRRMCQREFDHSGSVTFMCPSCDKGMDKKVLIGIVKNLSHKTRRRCTNCLKSQYSAWRRSNNDGYFCSTCGVYIKKHKRTRSASL